MTKNCATGPSITKDCAVYALTTSPIPPIQNCSGSSTPARKATARTTTFTTAASTPTSIVAGTISYGWRITATVQQRDHDRRHVRSWQSEGGLALVGSGA